MNSLFVNVKVALVDGAPIVSDTADTVVCMPIVRFDARRFYVVLLLAKCLAGFAIDFLAN